MLHKLQKYDTAVKFKDQHLSWKAKARMRQMALTWEGSQQRLTEATEDDKRGDKLPEQLVNKSRIIFA